MTFIENKPLGPDDIDAFHDFINNDIEWNIVGFRLVAHFDMHPMALWALPADVRIDHWEDSPREAFYPGMKHAFASRPVIWA